LIIREMQPIDLHRLRLAQNVPGDWRNHGPAMIAAGPCWSAVHDGQVIACAGLVLYWRGRAGTWCMIGADFPRRAWPWLHKQVCRRLAQAVRELRLRRVEAEALAGWQPGARWLRLLGFSPEGDMPAFGHDGADYTRWSLVQVAPRAAAPLPALEFNHNG
jgi:hypothetical protein